MRRRLKHVQIETTRHGRKVYYFRRGSSPRVRLPDGYASEEFREALALARAGTPNPVPKPPRPSFARTQRQDVERTLARALKRARQRAKGEFDLDLDWALATAERQGFKCPLSGVPFYMTGEYRSKVHPFAPSLDRIDCRRSYTRDNVRIVVYALNVMLFDWGTEIFERVANGYRATKRTNRVLFPPLPRARART